MARAFRITIGIVGFLAFAVVWHYFAPTQIGGKASYVTIRGVSMEPVMHKGDLVILQKQSHYELGDIAAYRSSDIHQVVLHRIVGRDGERYIMQGDNTQGPDRERPLQSDFVGKKWIQLNGMGTWLQRAREPKNSALLAGLAVLLAGGGVGAAQTRRRRKPMTTTPPLPRRGRPAAGGPAPTAVMVSVALVGGAALLLALVAFTRDTSQQVSVSNLWQQRGLFSYQASTQPGIAYPDGQVSTGQPVFLKLVKRLQVSFDYRASSKEALSLSGKASLVATVSAGNGWSKQIVLAPTRSFSGSSVRLTGTLDLATLHALKTQLQAITEVPIDSFVIVLQPHVSGKGLVAGQALEAAFSPAYTLRMDASQLQVETLGPSGLLTDNAPLRTESQPGTVTEPAQVQLKLFSPSVSQARILSLSLLALCLAALSALWLRARLRPEADEPTEIERRYGQLLVPVSSVQTGWSDPVEVESIEALVHLAERYDRAILHAIAQGVHHYMVEEEGSVYRYVAFDGVLVRREQEPAGGYGAPQPQAPTQPSSPPAQTGPGGEWPPSEPTVH